MTHNITITAPIKTISEANRKDYWRARAKRAKKQRIDAYWAVRSSGFEFKDGKLAFSAGHEKLIITLTRYGKRTMDDDNLACALKAVRDGVADAIGLDDGDQRIEWRYQQRIGDYAVKIDIWQAAKTSNPYKHFRYRRMEGKL